MNWPTENEALMDGFKRLPKYPMKANSKRRILQELYSLEADTPQSGARVKTKHPRRRVLNTAVAGVAGVLLVGTVGALAFSRMSSQSTTRRGLSQAGQSATNSAKPTAFGMTLPFSPKVPLHMPKGYHLAAVTANMGWSNGQTVFDDYGIQVGKRTRLGSRTVYASLLSIMELPRNSVHVLKHGSTLAVPSRLGIPGRPFRRLASTKQGTFYTAQSGPYRTVALASNQVTYFLYSRNLTIHQMVEMVRSMSVAVKVPDASRAAFGEKDALQNIAFKAVVPKSVQGNRFKLVSASSTVGSHDGAMTSQMLILTYEDAPYQGWSVTEAPLRDSKSLFPSGPYNSSYEYTWKDKTRGIGFFVQRIGKTSKANFLGGAKAFEAAEKSQ